MSGVAEIVVVSRVMGDASKHRQNITKTLDYSELPITGTISQWLEVDLSV